jgi:hypothetical protein
VSILAVLLVPVSRSFADAPDIQLTGIGAPTWKPVDFQLFSAPASVFARHFSQVYHTLLPYDSQPADRYTPHAPPYDAELSAGMIAGGYENQSVFTADAITLQPNGVYFAFMLVPDPGASGSSRDFALGPVIPHSLFPIAANADTWLDGILVDRLPGIDAVIPVQPKDIGFQGTSHLEALMAIWHPWDDDLTAGPLGIYDLRMSLRDVGGSGWDIVAPFRVVPELPGDFNLDGDVDAADYTTWRDHLGSTFDLNGNGDETGASAGIVDQADYEYWKQHFGSPGSGGGSSAAAPPTVPFDAAVPEPSAIALVLLGIVTLVNPMNRRFRNTCRSGRVTYLFEKG